MSDIEILPTPRRFPDIELETAAQPEPDEAQKGRVRKDAILERARRELRTAESALSFFREWSKNDQLFTIGTWGTKSYQWPEGIQNARLNDQRPCLTINRMRGFVRMVSNNARRANLRILVNPVDDESDPKLAEVIQGIIRNIERTSMAERVYATAADKQAEQGLSFFRIVAEWANDTSFRQRLKLKRIKDPRRVVFDPAGCEEADFSACEYVFYFTDVDADTYESITGKPAPVASAMSWGVDTLVLNDWFPGGKTIRIANYYCVERKPFVLLELASGEAVTLDQFTRMVEQEFASAKAENPYIDDADDIIKATVKEWRKDPAVVRRERTVRKKTWMHRIITPDDVLEESIWPASSHPFIPVVGEEIINPDTGELDFRGVPRDAADAAKFYNVGVSGLAEDIGLGHKSPVVGYKGQFGQANSAQRRAWEMANKKPVAFLEVDPMPMDDGKYAPLPIRNSYSPDIQSVVMGIQQGDQDLKTTAGFHEASLGEQGPQESRVAIVARQRQDEHKNSHYLENLRFALAVCGKQLIELIRVYYDEPTVMRITGAGDRTKKVLVYSGADKDPRKFPGDARKPSTMLMGQEIPGDLIGYKPPEGVNPDEIYDLSVGEFDVEVTSAQDPGSRRQESVLAQTEIMKVVPPQMAAAMAPMIAQKSDWPGAQEISEAMTRALPLELQPDQDDEDGPKIPPQIAAKMATMQEQGQALIQKVQDLEETVRTKKLELMAKHMSDRLKAWLELTKLAVTEDNVDRRLMLQKQMEVAGRFLDMNLEQLMAAQQQATETAGAPAAAPPMMPPVGGPGG